MEEKYYTPDIKEFGVEFEYELNYNDGWTKKCWDDNTSLSIPTIRELIKEEKIRVKYLDSSDLKELGFKKSQKKVDIRLYDGDVFQFGPFKIYLDKEINYCTITRCEHLYFPEEHEREITLYTGYLNNKSEVKWFMNRFNII